VVARLRAAGGIVLGKTKTGGSADALHPACGNPRAEGRTPGASSSGEAALAAARASPFGIGSDSGGSIRWPAHCCGVAGLKPSQGRVPNTGHFPPVATLADPRTVIGPLAPTVDDLAYVIELINGPDGIDAGMVPVPLIVGTAQEGRPLRIAWFGGWENELRGWGPSPGGEGFGIGTDETGRHALANAVAALKDAGHELVQAVPPHIEDARAITEVYWARPESMSLRAWRPPPLSRAQERLTVEVIEHSLFAWERLRRAMLAFMREFDVLLCPAGTRVAPVLGTSTIDDYAFTLPFSLTGQPVVSLPCAWSADGLPANVQVVGRNFEDLRVLRVAAALEARCGAVR
jgi:amidase